MQGLTLKHLFLKLEVGNWLEVKYVQEHFSFLFNDVVVDSNLFYHLDVENVAKKDNLSHLLHTEAKSTISAFLYSG